jgi:hypothetical protein
MASWKKVLVSGSSIEIASITSSATPSISSLTGYNVLMIDNTGKVNQITAGNFNAGLSTGSYSFTASAVNGGNFVIGDGATLRVSGSGGLTTTLSTAGSVTTIDVRANTGNGLAVVSNTISVDTGSVHFASGSKTAAFQAGNFVDSSEIDFTVTAGQSVTAALINGSIANARLANSTISGIALGSNLNSHTAGAGLSGTAYNGSAAQTWTVDSGSMLAFYSASIFSRISGDITISSAGVSAIGSSKVTNAMLVNSAVTITAGSGLTGGGSTALGASSTINVGAGTGITVNTDDIQLKNAGSLTNNVITKWDSSNGQLVNSGLTDDGTNLAINRATGIVGNLGVTGNISVTGSITGSAISSSGALSGLTVSSGTTVTAGTNIFAPNGYITAGSPGGAPNTAGAVQGQIGFFSSNVTVGGDLGVTGNANVTGNTTITGNLTVNGTTTTINTDNLLVEDRFALFASGSATATDGGIIVQAATGGGTATGFALGYHTTADRWAYQDALAFNASSFGTPTAYAVTAETGAGLPAANPAYGGATYGYGNIYVNSSNGDIFIYS